MGRSRANSDVRVKMATNKRTSSTQTWDEKTVALEGLFLRLPIQKHDASAGIPYQTLIPGMGRQLLLMSPNSQSSSRLAKKGNKKELRDLARNVQRTLKSLDDLSDAAAASLNFKPFALQQLKTELRILHACAECAVTVAFNPATMEAVSTEGGSGSITFIKESSPTSFAVEKTLQTKEGARTMALDTKTGHVFTMALEFTPAPPNAPPGRGGRAARGPQVPGSFSIIMVGR